VPFSVCIQELRCARALGWSYLFPSQISEASSARLLCSGGAFVCVALDWLAWWRSKMGSPGCVLMDDDDCGRVVERGVGGGRPFP